MPDNLANRERLQRFKVKINTELAAFAALYNPSAARFNLPHTMLQWESIGVDTSGYVTEREQVLLSLVCWTAASTLYEMPAPDLLLNIVRRWDAELAEVPTVLLTACFLGVERSRPKDATAPILSSEVAAAYYDCKDFLLSLVPALTP